MASGKDIFGYSNKVQSGGRVLTSPMVMVAITGGRSSSSPYLALVQNVTVDYRRQMTPVYEIGSDMILFNANGAQGTVSINRAIGSGVAGSSGTMLAPFAPSDPCSYQTVVISGSNNGDCAMKSGSVTATGMLQQVGVTVNAGGALVTDSATYNIISLSQSS